MNSKQTREHRVEQTPPGRFAVIAPDGEVIGVVHDEALALMAAARLDAEPVRNVSVLGRWTPPRDPQSVLAVRPHPPCGHLLPQEKEEDDLAA